MTEHSFKRLLIDTCGTTKAEILFSAFKKFQKGHVYELKNIEDIIDIKNDLAAQIARQRHFTTQGKRFIVDCVLNDVIEILQTEHQVNKPNFDDFLKCNHTNVNLVRHAYKCVKCGNLIEPANTPQTGQSNAV